jgi:hypothetical protein
MRAENQIQSPTKALSFSLPIHFPKVSVKLFEIKSKFISLACLLACCYAAAFKKVSRFVVYQLCLFGKQRGITKDFFFTTLEYRNVASSTQFNRALHPFT